MRFMVNLKSIFSRKSESPTTFDLTEESYAMLPFQLLTSNQPPFDQWQKLTDHVPKELEQFWKGSIVQYQLFLFHVVNVSVWGNDFGKHILSTQVRLMNQAEPGWGDNHESGIRKFYDVVQRAMSNPQHATGKNGEALEIPIEYHLAVDFLVTSPDSPYRTDRDKFDMDGPPTFSNEEDWKLAIDLERAKVPAMEHFQNATKIVRVVNK